MPSLAIYDYHYVIGFVGFLHVTDKSMCSKLASSGADALSQNPDPLPQLHLRWDPPLDAPGARMSGETSVRGGRANELISPVSAAKSTPGA